MFFGVLGFSDGSLSRVPPWFFAGFAFVLGTIVASFLGVVGERVPRGETLGGRSHCVCGAPLGAWSNIPVLGWILSRGVAACCGAAIPRRYVLSEVGLGVVWAAGVVLVWWGWLLLALISGALLLAMNWVEVE